jgi:ankyrin repeat protein
MSTQVNQLEKLLREYQELPEFQGSALTSVNQQGGFKSTPLHIAIYRRNPREVQSFLAAGANPNAPGEFGERPIQVAVNCGRSEIVEQLLRTGAQCELKDEKGMDAWQVAEAVGFKQELEEIVRRVDPSQLPTSPRS